MVFIAFPFQNYVYFLVKRKGDGIAITPEIITQLLSIMDCPDLS